VSRILNRKERKEAQRTEKEPEFINRKERKEAQRAEEKENPVNPEIRVQNPPESVAICEICVQNLLTAKYAKKRKEQKKRKPCKPCKS
jgi:hypothetical protein